ncbi:MAG: transglutaminase-like cysteine peptidase [Alphaproteobacteria bacterium]|nr:transglutaminase-like cysteine peptidase [Alphaproteobacteria bacterium]
MLRGRCVQNSKNIRKKGILRVIKAYLDHHKLGELLLIGGYIGHRQLAFALAEQKRTDLPLGQVFIDHQIISRRELSFILARQRALRFIAAFLLCAMSLSFTARKARADTIADVPAKISVSVSLTNTNSANIGRISIWPALFGADEQRSDNLSAFTKWEDMFSRFDKALDTRSGQKVALELKKELSPFKNMKLEDMAVAVNSMMNKKKYILDKKNWGKSDYWATPIEFMTRGGDCEDFAIAKYAALRALGVSESRLRLVIVHDENKNIPHAVLAVYTQNGPLILDNQIKTVEKAEAIAHYRPIFSINREAWWLHSAPSETVIASAH